MDVDVEIISEDGDCPNPLFDSIMNAMNSMKEATADKIYQKIQREGEHSYSKPQQRFEKRLKQGDALNMDLRVSKLREVKNYLLKVDRALANALRYGIFEKRNNRYRVRDDMLDDEDTVYWNLNKNRVQTPFRFQEDYSDSQKGLKLDPEKDNRRFSKPTSKKCRRCRRLKRPEKGTGKVKGKVEKKKKISLQKGKNISKKKGKKNLKTKAAKTHDLKKKEMAKKKILRPMLDKNLNKISAKETKATLWAMNYPYLRSFSFDGSLNDLEAGKNIMLGKSTYDSTDSEEDTLSSPTDEQSFKSYPDEGDLIYRDPYKEQRSVLSSEYENLEDFGYSLPKKMKSNDSLKSETGSEKSDLSSVTNATSTPSLSGLNVPSTSKNLNEKEINQYIASGGEVINNKFEKNKINKCCETTDWMGCSDEPQTAIIQTKNVLTIEPIDSLTLKSQDHTTYVS